MVNDELEELLADLTTDQLRYVLARINSSSDVEAARKVGINPKTVANWGDKVSVPVRMLLMDTIKAATLKMKKALLDAVDIKLAGLHSKNEATRQSVSTEIIDRLLGKPINKSEITGKDGKSIPVDMFIDSLRKAYGSGKNEEEKN